MASTTDVREWLRGQGEDVGDRGAIRRDLVEKYEAAHPTVPGEVIGDEYPPAPDVPDDPGVTRAADVPPGRPEPGGEERRPRPVPPSGRGRGKGKGGLRKLFSFGGGRRGGRRRGGSKVPRVPLGDFAEETWTDLAWLAEPIPPLARILEIQAPYAGIVFEDHVAGTVLDTALQPLARYSGVYRALNGLLGPPVCVLAICTSGRYLEQDGRVLVDPRTGRPVPDQRTRMLFGMLRYSLLQMTKVSELSSEEIKERTEDMAGRITVVNQIISDLFSFPAAAPPPASSPPAGPPAAPPAREGAPYAYPDAPSMDGAGADPGRL